MLRIDRPRIATTVHQLAAGLLRSRLLMGYMALGILSGFGNGGPAGLIAAVVNYGLLAVYVVIVFLWTDTEFLPSSSGITMPGGDWPPVRALAVGRSERRC